MSRRSMHSAFAAALLATTIAAVPAGAQQPPKPPPAPVTVTLKPDVVILGNGDRLQGENLTLYESYDNRPPSAEANNNDAGAALSIGFTF